MKFDDVIKTIKQSTTLTGQTVDPSIVIVAAAIVIAGNDIANAISSLGDDVNRAAKNISSSIEMS